VLCVYWGSRRVLPRAYISRAGRLGAGRARRAAQDRAPRGPTRAHRLQRSARRDRISCEHRRGLFQRIRDAFCQGQRIKLRIKQGVR